jgi:multicomponent Na+:H+ antiporter subunit B
LLFLILAINILQMPSSFTTDAITYNEAVWHYIDNSVSETGAINIVAAIITDYRAFDTLGETIVLFTSIVAVASILKVAGPKKEIK